MTVQKNENREGTVITYRKGVVLMNNNAQVLPNLIPAAGSVNGDYLCTWRNQGVTARALGVTGEAGSDVRDVLDQDRLFGSRNHYHTISEEQRSNLIFLLDDGWDVPYGTPNDAAHKAVFGSVEPDPEKFSQFGNYAHRKTLRHVCQSKGDGVCRAGAVDISPAGL